MSKYSLYNFSQETVNEIKQNGSEWSLDIYFLDDFLVELPKLVQKFDLSEIITNVRHNGSTIFNNVGTKAPYAQLAKWTENAINNEQQGENEKANNQWKAIKVVLYEAQNQGIGFCSLIRGWENNKGAAQGDQILKLLEKNLQETKNHKIKSEIFNLILEEANKGEYGLYAIPSNYTNNENVKHAANEHKKWYESVIKDDDFSMLQALSNSIDLSEDDSTLSPEMSTEQNNLNDQQFADLVHQATSHANGEEIPHAQPSTSSNRVESGTENTILGMPINDLATLINAGVQTLDGSTNPQDTQGRTAEDFVTQVSNLLQATGGDINNLWGMIPDILGNPQNTNDAWDLD